MLAPYYKACIVFPGEPSNQCPSGFFLDTDGPYCQGKIISKLSRYLKIIVCLIKDKLYPPIMHSK